MSYKPLDTTMERITVLTNLRKKEIIFPQDFRKPSNDKQLFLISWLLDHDISKRPSAQELLQSDHVPPPVLEERELRELLRHTLNNPQLKAYKYLIESCFKQSVRPAQDIMYNNETPLPNNVNQLYTYVQERIIKVFQRHGGQDISTPLLMPKSKIYETVDTCVNLMTHSGGIVALPYDLRAPFARYVARNGVNFLRRYAIEKVYREKKIFDSHPRELFECAFDIVTPTQGNLMTDAELIYILFEIFNEFQPLKSKTFTIFLNHTLLLEGLLLYCGIKEKKKEIFNVLAEAKVKFLFY